MPDGMIDERKVAAARRYFQRHFQALEVYDFEKADRIAQVFRVYHPEFQLDYTAVLPGEFLNAHDAAEIERLLEHWQTADVMRTAGRHEVVITEAGPYVAQS